MVTNEAAAAFDALGSPTRRRILAQVMRGPRSVGEIAASLPVSRPAVSRHLRQLEQARLVSVTRRGTRSEVQLERVGFELARASLALFWDDALLNFAALVEEEA